ncbi:MAG: hypothetical protein ACC655_06290 [Rhodothermia bacterium]
MISRACLVLVLPFVAGCGGMSNSTSTESSGGAPSDRFAGLVDDERETVMIATSDESAGEYRMSPAVFDTVIVRSVPAVENEPRVVEALLKGSFPDGCTELQQLMQSKTAGGQSATLTMRRPVSAICTQVVRPYRFFFELDFRYPPGDYMLVVNDRSFAFTVR